MSLKPHIADGHLSVNRIPSVPKSRIWRSNFFKLRFWARLIFCRVVLFEVHVITLLRHFRFQGLLGFGTQVEVQAFRLSFAYRTLI